MTSMSDLARTKPQPESDMSLAQDRPGDCKPNVLIDSAHALAVSNTEPSLRQRSEKRDIEPSGPTGQHDEIVITVIRATDVALGLRRLRAGFFAVLHHSGLEWRTENNPSSENQDIVKWNGPILISSDMSATICLEVYASFEFQPMLGNGEQLQRLTVTVKQLLERSEADFPLVFFPKDGDVVSPCTFLFITVKRQKRGSASPSTSKVLGSHWSTPEAQSGLEIATNSGHGALFRYQKGGEKQDLEDAIREFEHALSLCPVDHPCRAVTLSNLAMAELICFQVGGKDTRLAAALWMYHDALAVRPVGHPDRPSALIHTATVHLARCDNRKCYAEEEQAQTLLGEALGSRSTGSHARQAASVLQSQHPRRNIGPMEPDLQSTAYTDLGDFSAWLLERFKQFGDLADLQQAIAILQDLASLGSTSLWDNWYFWTLQNLGTAFWYRFQRLGKLADLEDSISRLTAAANLTPHGHPIQPSVLNNLGTSLETRFLRLGEVSDLEDAISRLRDAVELTPHGHPNQPCRLNNLGTSLETRFLRLGEVSDLENAISMLKDAVDLTPHSHPNQPDQLTNLGNSLQTRFKHLGEVSDLEDAISTLTAAADLTPHGHPSQPSVLDSLGSSLIIRFKRLGEVSDLEDAISRLRDAVDLTPHGHPDRPYRLNNLGISLETRFLRLGEVSDLEDAISILRDAADLTPHGHPDQPGYLNNLGNFLKTRFLCLGEVRDLEDAVSRLRDAVDLTPHGHPDQPGHLNNLGISLQTRFLRLGEVSDLEDAISILRDAVDLTPHGHPDQPVHLNNLGNSFKTRFERLGEVSDLEDAIATLRDAVDLTPHGHPDQPCCFNNLGVSLIARFKRLGKVSDLEDAISRLRDAVDLTPHGHPDQPDYLNNLGNSLRARFLRLGEVSDLEDAISRLRDAVDLTPHGHPGQPDHLTNLSTSLIARFKRLGKVSDLEDAISRLRDAVDLIPHGRPDKPSFLFNLGMSFTTYLERLGEHKLEQAISIFSCAASSPIGSITYRFRASQQWISCARRIRHPSLLHACSISLQLIPQLAWIGLSLTHRYQQLTQAADIVQEAAAAALDAGFPTLAVEWLEQGRSIIWGELFQLRGSYEDLSAAYPDHARRLRELSVELDQTSAHRDISSKPTGTSQTIQSFRQLADKQRRLAIERDKLLQVIRRLPGFEQFLRRKRFSQLRAAAHAGPVVILNAAETRNDALIVLADVDHVIHVPLTKFTLERCTNLQGILTKYVRYARSGKPIPEDGGSWEHVLSPLWQSVVKPVLDALAISVPSSVDLPRIFWCPTGPLSFVPIHAAGLYDRQYAEPGHKVFDFVVSSYIPTLSILSQLSGPDVAPSRRGNLRLLLVRQPSSDGHNPLAGVEIELGRIKAIVGNSPGSLERTTVLETSDGTVKEVLNLMKEADWVHFACHGVQDGLDSGLCLAHGCRLKLRELAAFSRPRGGLAFLSACQTAKGEQKLSEEAIHMAAGMLFAGYEGVVGTMWSISDRLAPDVTRDVYATLFEKGTMPDPRDAARALHDAIGGLRERGVRFADWIPFIHVGL